MGDVVAFKKGVHFVFLSGVVNNVKVLNRRVVSVVRRGYFERKSKMLMRFCEGFWTRFARNARGGGESPLKN